MRGALSILHHQMAPSRIIPADAGSTCLSYPNLSAVRDHPRGCGEHYAVLAVSLVFLGSSPRMRGAQTETSGTKIAARIIPADAGSTAQAVAANASS